jgi:hypothetical protein
MGTLLLSAGRRRYGHADTERATMSEDRSFFISLM